MLKVPKQKNIVKIIESMFGVNNLCLLLYGLGCVQMCNRKCDFLFI